MTNGCTVKLDVFEGPLDLLLHLIKKNEVQITDIPIASITDQYLALLEAEEERHGNLDGAGEYLVMAATLTFIKSRMLLPVPEGIEEEPEEDPRAQLVRQLLEYQRYREVAVALGDRNVLTRDVFASPGEPMEPAPENEPAAPLVRDASLADLLEALRDVLARHRPPPSHEVAETGSSVTESIQRILAGFTLADTLDFASLFGEDVHLARIIVTFLALLELIRLKVVRATQAEPFGPIVLVLAVPDLNEAAARVRDLGEPDRTTGGEGELYGDVPTGD
jgi:segregation and condensation protein A